MENKKNYHLKVTHCETVPLVEFEIILCPNLTLQNLAEIIFLTLNYENDYWEFEVDNNVFIEKFSENNADFLILENELSNCYAKKTYHDAKLSSLADIYTKFDTIDLTHDVEVKNEFIIELIQETDEEVQLKEVSEYYVPDQLGVFLFNKAFAETQDTDLLQLKDEIIEEILNESSDEKKRKIKNYLFDKS